MTSDLPTEFVKAEGIIQMKSFSMGYTPNKIIAKFGDDVILNITNIDIPHAIDINEFDVHEILPAGESKLVKFKADKKGEFLFYCGLPGHTEAGMKGTIKIT